MVGKRIGQDQSVPSMQDGVARRPSSPFEILVSHDGGVMVDGAPLHVSEGEPVHVAVLDTMHRHAQTRGELVEAVILDRQRGGVTRVEVAPDGSSRILLHEELDETGLGEPGPAPGQSPADAAPSGRRPLVETGRAPVSDSTVAGPPADTPRPEAEGTAAVEEVPEELGGLVALVGRSVADGALERAAALAFRLREHTVRTFGPEHRYTLEAHALEAFVAYRNDNPVRAMTMCLELARIRHRQGDPRAREELKRATAAWLRIEDVPSAVEQGRDLLDVCSESENQSEPMVADATLLQVVNRRMRVLAEESKTG
ncbi:hypothetical protein [Streptomyces sp. RP5T]|uniref:hypothetical protein n=1 Tax=Streptomyces sp. RP5T TaxID=2490848 RepID=UPI000F653CF2|nr:hypothetical protein [Streptomyces sp. RP5T]RRR86550.1 hypothetical protein EHS43_04030 [Streptomyces sp. RP5T]